MKARTQVIWLIATAGAYLGTAMLYRRQHPLPESLPFFLLTRLPFVLALVYLGLRRRSLSTWIFLSILLGVLIGHDFPALAIHLRVLSRIFLRLIGAIIAPLIFSTLVIGIAGHANLKQVGRMGLKSIIYFELVTTLALVIGLVAINVSRAGVGAQIPVVAAPENLNVTPQSASDLLLHAFPENIAKAVAEGQILQVVIFAVLFAIALALVSEEKRRPMLSFMESLSAVMFKFTGIVMLFAPIGVGAEIASTVAQTGVGILKNLGVLLITLYVALLAFLLLVLLPAALLARVPVKAFVKAVAEPATIAFATSNSEAALPRAMECMEAMGVPRSIVAFVIPTGYSFNLDGSTLYQALAAVFVAQASGIELSISQQVTLLLTLMLASKGTAGVSRASLVILMGVAGSFHLPTEPILILLGVDQLMDMGRTAVNVIGNCLASAVVARWEGEFPAKSSAAAV